MYFVIKASEDGDVSVGRVASKEHLLSQFRNTYYYEGAWHWPEQLKFDNTNLILGEKPGILIIKGEIVEIKPKQVFTDIDVA